MSLARQIADLVAYRLTALGIDDETSIETIRFTAEVKEGRVAKCKIFLEHGFGGAVPSEPPLDPAIVRRVNGSR